MRSNAAAASRSLRSSAKASASRHSAARGREPGIAGEVLPRQRERVAGAVDRHDAPRAAGERRERESPRVAEDVERLATRRECAHRGTVVALVEVEAGLLAGDDVDAVGEAVLDQQDRVGQRAVRDSGARREALQAAHIGIGSLEDAGGAGRRGQRRDDRIAPALAAGGRQLQHDRVAVAIGDDAGQSVGLAVDQPAARMPRVQHRRAGRDGALDATGEERVVDRFRRVESPDPGPDLRGRRIRGVGEQPRRRRRRRRRCHRSRGRRRRRRSRRRISRDGAASAISRDPASAAARRARPVACRSPCPRCRVSRARRRRIGRWRRSPRRRLRPAASCARRSRTRCDR